MSLYKLFETNKDVERDGITLKYGESISIRIRRAGGSNAEYVKALERVMKSRRVEIQSGRLSMDENRSILAEVYAKSVVIGWEGVTDREGNALPFTRENVVKVLTDLPDLFADIQKQADDASHFLAAIDETDSKN